MLGTAADRPVVYGACRRYHVVCNGLVDHICPCDEGVAPDARCGAARAPPRMNGAVDAFVKIARNEGVLALWRGLPPTLVMAVPATTIYFGAYEWVRGKLDSLGQFAAPLAGGVARVWSVTLISPLEMVRTKIQSRGHLGYLAIADAVRASWRADGVRVIWYGLSATLMRDVPFSALYWTGYEGIRQHLMGGASRNVSTPLPVAFASGAASGLVRCRFHHIIAAARPNALTRPPPGHGIRATCAVCGPVDSAVRCGEDLSANVAWRCCTV